MGLFEAVVVFVIVWWLIFLPMLSAGGQSQAEAGDVAPGTEPGAPRVWNARNKLVATTISAFVLTGLVWLGMTYYQQSIGAG